MEDFGGCDTGDRWPGMGAAVRFRPPERAQLERVHLAEIVSEPGEALEAFMLRLAPVLDRHTRESGHEVCGMVAQSADAERFGVRLGTTKGR